VRGDIWTGNKGVELHLKIDESKSCIYPSFFMDRDTANLQRRDWQKLDEMKMSEIPCNLALVCFGFSMWRRYPLLQGSFMHPGFLGQARPCTSSSVMSPCLD
jgi:hypothetical protein